ncbi:MFS transporter [Actinopolymorpha sp. B17G11]|uniref:MFS transporter n=1 Tax=Actinopolymorpha sp. B17G11 TaxID=3160861 RepID=UPI0032E39DC9
MPPASSVAPGTTIRERAVIRPPRGGPGQDQSPSEGAKRKGFSSRWFYASIASGSLGMAMTAPITALYAKALGASDSLAALIVSSMFASFLCMDLLCSRVVPRVNVRHALVGGYLVFGVGSFVTAVSPNLTLMTGARVLQGLAVAFIVGAGFHTALRLASAGREGREIARFNSCSFFGMTIGPLIVGAVASIAGGLTGMRWGFAVCGVVNVATALVARFALPSMPVAARPEFGLPRLQVFQGWRTRSALAAAGLGFGLRSAAGMTLLPLLGHSLGASVQEVAAATMCMSVSEMGGILLSGRLADRLGRRPVVVISACLSVFALLIALVDLPLLGYFLLSTAMGFVMSAVRVVPVAMIVDVAATKEAAAIGWRLACDVSSLLTAAVTGAMLGLAGLAGGFAYAAVIAAVVGVLALVIGETRRTLPPQPAASAHMTT